MEKNYKKELQLKGNSVKRLIKEYQSYVKEVDGLKGKLEQMKEENTDEYTVEKFTENIKESEGARDQVKLKLEKFTEELSELISEVTDEEVKNLEEYKKAVEFLDTAAAELKN